MRICPYCGEYKFKKIFLNQYNKYIINYGPFDLYVCGNCESLYTYPLPNDEDLAFFYNKLENGMPSLCREARKEFPQDAIYLHYIKALLPLLSNGSLLDLGAGNGEFLQTIGNEIQNSDLKIQLHGADFVDRPKNLSSRIKWFTLDLNQDYFHKINQKFSFITSFAVFEHVKSPNHFFKMVSLLLDKNGKAMIIFPAYDSLLSKILGLSWPYFSSGEHLTIPTYEGLINISRRYFKNTTISRYYMPYSINYILKFYRLDVLCRLIPRDFFMPLPTGLFKLVINNS